MQIHDYRRIYVKVGDDYCQFEASDQDTSASDYHYFGFLASNGSWVIQRFDLTVTDKISYRYSSGQTGYAAAWVGKAALTYELFNEITTL